MGYRRGSDGYWYKPDGTRVTGNTGAAPMRVSSVPTSPAWDPASNPNPRANQRNNAPTIQAPAPVINTPASTALSPSAGGGGAGGTTSTGGGSSSSTTGGAAKTNTAPGGRPFAPSDYLTGTPGDFASGYAADQYNSVMQDPGVLSRAVLRNQGLDPDSGYGAYISQDAQSVSPLAAFLMGQTGGGLLAPVMFRITEQPGHAPVIWLASPADGVGQAPAEGWNPGERIDTEGLSPPSRGVVRLSVRRSPIARAR